MKAIYNDTTRKISASILKEAVGIAGGLHKMNAKYATHYAFCFSHGQITYGEFISDRMENDKRRMDEKFFDAYITLVKP